MIRFPTVLSAAQFVLGSALVLAAWASPDVRAQGTQPAPAAAASPAADNLRDRITAVEARRDLDDATRRRIVETYRQAIAELDRAAALRADNAAAERAAADAPTEVRRMERALELTQKDLPASRDAALAQLSTPDLEKREAAVRDAAIDARRELDDLERAAEDGATATTGLRGRQEKARATLELLREDLAAAPPAGQSSALSDARRQLTRARVAALQAELELLGTQLTQQPVLQRMRELRRDVARQTLERASDTHRRVLTLLEQRRAEDAVKARAAASQAEQRYSDQPTAVRAIAAANAELAAQLAEVTLALDRTLLEISRLRGATAEVDASLRLIERRAESRTLGREFAQTLLERLRRLPKPQDYARPREEREPLMVQVSDANVRVERALEELGSVDAATARAMRNADAALPEADRNRVEDAVRAELNRQRVLLLRLDEQQDALVRAFNEVDEAEHELVARNRLVQDRLMQLLFWVPLNPIGPQTITNLRPAADWMFSPVNWREAGALVAAEARRHAPLTALVFVAVGVLYGGRRRLKAQLDALAPHPSEAEHYRVTQTLGALAITFALALPFSLAAWFTGWLLTTAPNAAGFAHALGHALQAAGQLYVTLFGFSWLFNRRGVAIRHFHWHAATMGVLQTSLRKFTFGFVPLLFVVAMNGTYAPPINSESIGRLAFILAMAWVAVFTFGLFRRSAPLMSRMYELHPDWWLVRLHPLWFALLVALPIAIGVLAASGFYYAAGYLFGRMMNMLMLGLGTLMVYGVISLWVVMQRTRLQERQMREGADDIVTSQPTDRGTPHADTVDIAAIGAQSRQLLNLLTTMLALAGLWLIWKDALPALRVAGDFVLWTYADTIDGEQITRPLTLGGLVVALLAIVVTVVTVKNIGALLDIVLLQRLALQADATYAIKTVTRYAIAGVGIVFATGLLGISWGKLQWLIAALGVGLGFGLQEIVANFVSGLIVLAERPIRIGDIVTVGDVSGTVARIRARATSVIDFDNKEVLIPNKAFITERVVNWTLTNKTTRLLIKVGIAYGSDIDAAQAAMYQAVRANPDVMVEPPYSVFFVGFGDSALNFEIRAYVDSIDKRLRVTHALNVAIERALSENGISIPFPQREVILRTAPGTVLPLPPAP